MDHGDIHTLTLDRPRHVSRAADNYQLSPAEHLRVHDRDLDAIEARVAGVIAELKALKLILIGVLVSTATSSVLLAIQQVAR